MLTEKIGHKLDLPLYRGFHLIFRKDINPSILTLGGLLTNVLGAFAFGYGKFSLGGVIVLTAGFFDLLDGAVARVSGRTSKFGCFLDSVIDRYSDTTILIGLVTYYALKGDVVLVVLIFVVCLGTILIPYTRAKAEIFLPRCNVGLLERPERIIILALGGIFHLIPPALWALAFLTHLTVGQRIYFTWKEMKNETG